MSLDDWRLEELGESSRSARSDRDVVFINRLYEQDANGDFEHRMIYVSFRRVESFADTDKLDAVLAQPRHVLQWNNERAEWRYDAVRLLFCLQPKGSLFQTARAIRCRRRLDLRRKNATRRGARFVGFARFAIAAAENQRRRRRRARCGGGCGQRGVDAHSRAL